MHERERLPKFQCKRSKLPIVRIYDFVLMQLLKETENDLTSLKHFIYATLLAATKKMKKKKAPIKNVQKQPKWKERMTKEIKMLRGGLSILHELSKRNIIKTRKARKVKRKYKLFDMNEILKSKELVKQKLQVKTGSGLIFNRYTQQTKSTAVMITIIVKINCPGYDIKLHPFVEFRRGIMRLPFAATTPRSPLSKV